MLLLIIILILVFGGGLGYYGHTAYGPWGGGGIGLGTILLIFLICYMFGAFRHSDKKGEHRKVPALRFTW